MIDVCAIRARYDALAPHLDERARRLFAASEARAGGRGGVAAVCEATGIARSTIGRGLSDLRCEDPRLAGRIRRPGGGRKSKAEIESGLLEALGDLVQSAIRGDPEAALLWVSKSQRHLARALAERGFTASQKLVGRLLRQLGFSLQSNRKTLEGAAHPDRDAQFEHINQKIKERQAAGQPAISVDTKKKELVGDFKNGGRELRPKGDPVAVRVHDFQIPELGKVAPYGVYDITANTGWVNLGIDHEYGFFRCREHPALVARPGQGMLSRCNQPSDHCRLRRQQWGSCPIMEARTPSLRHRNRACDHRLPLSAWHK